MSLAYLTKNPDHDRPEGDEAEAPKADAPKALPPTPERHLSLREEFLACLDQIELRAPSRPVAVQLMGPRGGEGTSTLAHELARCAAARGTSVLLVHLPDSRPEGDAVAPPPSPGREATLAADLDQLEAIALTLSLSRQRGRPAELQLGPAAATALRESKSERERLLHALKQRFEMVLVDSPPVLAGNDGLRLAPSTDGVVLVVEAEETRRPVAQAAVERIRDAGATLLGLMFNKRRHHIPDAVYRLL